MRKPLRGCIMSNHFCEKKFFSFFVELLGLVATRNTRVHFAIRGSPELYGHPKQS